MQPLVECVPNFSEGRRPEVVEAIVSAVRSVRGVSVLDCSSDADHNRSVLTFVGDPEAVEEAAFAAVQKAAELIDMFQHSGGHPRIGATDVVPFIPIRGVQMADCVQMAQRLGKRVGSELGIPVYLYEQAATRLERWNLEAIRRGEYEGLAKAIKMDADRAPDYGPLEIGSAGATVIGARAPLIAYNIYLNTDDVEAARKIALAVRYSGGGLHYIKALGLLVDNHAQVSMNLTDFTRTPLHRVQELVKVEAARYGHQVAYSELVGLIPEQALVDSARWYLQLDRFSDEQILERRLHAVEQEATRPDAFIDAIASGEPTPGGGAVASLAGALAAALAAMVARTTIGKKKYAHVEEAMRVVAGVADELRGVLTQMITDDSAAFEAVMAAFRLSKEDPARPEAIQAAFKRASAVPLQTVDLALKAMQQLQIVVTHGNTNAVTDAAVGVHMALAAIEGATLNVLVNLQSIEATDRVETMTSEITRLRQSGRSLASEILTTVQERMGIGV
jgi:glutamate formiminotransferase/formiminotetrahydrofolate cyclodeaminase